MAAGTEKLYRTFVKGLITEASPLTFPENASIDEENFVLERDGSRSRRLGVDYEGGYSLTSTGFTAGQLATGKQSFHKWETPGGDTTKAIGVIRINDKLWFVDLLTNAPSSNLLNSASSITISGLSSSEIETTTINNKLILVSADLSKPILLTYNTSTDTVTQAPISILVRDIWGVDDTLDVNSRPATLSNSHKYNLKMLQPAWKNFALGPILRQQKDFRTYTDIFKEDSNYLNNLRFLLLFTTIKNSNLNELKMPFLFIYLIILTLIKTIKLKYFTKENLKLL